MGQKNTQEESGQTRMKQEQGIVMDEQKDGRKATLSSRKQQVSSVNGLKEESVTSTLRPVLAWEHDG